MPAGMQCPQGPHAMTASHLLAWGPCPIIPPRHRSPKQGGGQQDMIPNDQTGRLVRVLKNVTHIRILRDC